MLITTNLSPTYPKNTKKITKIKGWHHLAVHFKFVYVATRCCSSLVCFLFLVKTEGEFLLHFKVFCCGRSTHHADSSGKERERERKWCMYLPPVSNQNKATCKSASFFSLLLLGIRHFGLGFSLIGHSNLTSSPHNSQSKQSTGHGAINLMLLQSWDSSSSKSNLQKQIRKRDHQKQSNWLIINHH